VNKAINCSILAIVLASLLGCSGYYGSIRPTHVPLGESEMSTFSPPNPVALINGQKDISTALADDTSYNTNLSEWSRQASLLIRQWLTINGVPVVENAEKKLTITILNPKVKPGLTFASVYLELCIKTGDGKIRIYPAEASARGLGRCAGYAINYSVVQIIQDQTIAQYIAN
jgi:hypothetical protein